MATTKPTTNQVLADHPYLLYFIDESNEVKKWAANRFSTDDNPVVDVTVYQETEVDLVPAE